MNLEQILQMIHENNHDPLILRKECVSSLSIYIHMLENTIRILDKEGVLSEYNRTIRKEL